MIADLELAFDQVRYARAGPQRCLIARSLGSAEQEFYQPFAIPREQPGPVCAWCKTRLPVRPECASRDLQRRCVASVQMGLHYDLYVLVERHQETQKRLYRELAEFPAQHFRYVGLSDT